MGVFWVNIKFIWFCNQAFLHIWLPNIWPLAFMSLLLNAALVHSLAPTSCFLFALEFVAGRLPWGESMTSVSSHQRTVPRFWFLSGWNLKALVVPAVIECGCLAWTAWELDLKLWLPFYILIRTSAQQWGCMHAHTHFLFVHLFLCFHVFAHRWHTEIFSLPIFVGLFDYAEVAENLNIICYAGIFHR